MTMEMERRGATIVNLLAYKAERAKQHAQAVERSRVSPLARSAWRLPSSRQIAHRRQMLEHLIRAGCGPRAEARGRAAREHATVMAREG